MITLCTAATPNGQKIHIFLEEAGPDYEVRWVESSGHTTQMTAADARFSRYTKQGFDEKVGNADDGRRCPCPWVQTLFVSHR